MFRCDFDGAREPAGESAVEQGVADKKHKEHREQGNGRGADDHFRFEASPELLAAVFHPETKKCAKQNKKKNDEGSGNERRNGVERQILAPVTRIEGGIERAQSEHRGEEQGEDHSCDEKPAALAGSGGGHVRAELIVAESGTGSTLSSGDCWGDSNFCRRER